MSGLFKYDHNILLTLSNSLTWMTLLVSALCIVVPVIASAVIVFIGVRDQRRHIPRCKLLGVEDNKSNISDQYDERYSKSTANSDNSQGSWKVKSLWVFPIKSCSGIELQHGQVVKTGMAYDRQFALAQLLMTSSDKSNPSSKKEQEWKFITQRERPQMARVRTEIWIPELSLPLPKYCSPDDQKTFTESQGILILLFPIEKGFWGLISRLIVKMGGSKLETQLRLPWNPSPAQIERLGYKVEKMAIWKDKPDSLLMGSTRNDANQQHRIIMEKLREFLEISNPLAIFRVPADPVRNLYRCAPKKEELGYQAQVGFQDSYPLHIMNLASVHNLSSRLAIAPTPAPGKPQRRLQLNVLRFRPNIIVTGPEAYDEDDWKLIKIGKNNLYHVCSRTSRCKLPNVDPLTGLKDPLEPDKTMRSFRTIDLGAPNKACLGMQMVPASEEEGEICVGDTIEVLQRGEHFFLKG